MNNPQKITCPICHNDANSEQGSKFADIKCVRCGRFLVNLSEGMPSVTSPDQMVRLSGWVREQNAAGRVLRSGICTRISLTVIPTCRADEIKNLHFDIRHLNTLPWNAPSDLADNLAKRIRAAIGTGPNV
jgi:hypothetical protein